MALKRTPLYECHARLGARLIEFGGWEMPIQYKDGIKKEHAAVRDHAGVFDVSHMGEFVISGPGAFDAVQRIITNDANKLASGGPNGKALYTVMCNEQGGIVDDCIVYGLAADEFLFIVNASNIEKDFAWIRSHCPADVTVKDDSDNTALIAIQGPNARNIVNDLAAEDVLAIKRFQYGRCRIDAADTFVARTGYTGEDGFELMCDAKDGPGLWDALVEAGAAPIGLGARDTLRLEARLCLYGNDITDDTTPYEAGLGWVVKPDAKDFLGKDALLAQKEAGIKRKLVGFQIEGRGIPRQGYPILKNNEAVGQVTSGTTGITVGCAIGMGYVPTEFSKPATKLTIDCRGKMADATVVSGPFYKRD